jgi:glutathione S-transferase
MLARPGVEKGRHVPDRHKMKELQNDPAKQKEQAEKNMAWVQQGMKADAKK